MSSPCHLHLRFEEKFDKFLGRIFVLCNNIIIININIMKNKSFQLKAFDNKRIYDARLKL